MIIPVLNLSPWGATYKVKSDYSQFNEMAFPYQSDIVTYSIPYLGISG